MKISISVKSSMSNNAFTYNLDDLGFTESEWAGMSADEKRSAIQEAASNHPEQPEWIVSKWSEK
jgi:hypothetical protein